ncbi:3'-5' exonuclease [Agitococcus lubricus]|uniref:Exodeoxyribonuclease X n=1 Tax=Agitococcus lubricus TaxID=1077255 RepID=A0A2T5IRU0_9GAMM|nr:3'-5' exonuclease [Agitococcus lubricus]PTQ86555.1 exodeoxyribonuclease X [Agitococcus lubricus]
MQAIIADTETTGLKEPVPVEIAYLDVSRLFSVPIRRFSFDPVFEYRQLFDPQKPIEFGAMATHHITNEDVAGYDPYTAFELPNVKYLIGHNIDFDYEVIKACGEQPEPKLICTLAIARYLYPELDSHKLTALLYALDMPYALDHAQHAHSALDDVWMTYHLLKIMLPKTQATTFEELYQFSEMARIPKIITFGKHNGQPIKSLPSDYKQWLLKQNDLDPYLRKALTAS